MLSIRAFKGFIRYNAVTLLATATDFLVMVFLAEVFEVWYLASAAIGTISGGIVDFTLKRRWAFREHAQKVIHHSLKYSLVWLASFGLNTGGVFLLVEFLHMPYAVAKVFAAVAVGLGFNYNMQKYYVFR